MRRASADRIRGLIYGLLVGDAMGVPYEFQYPAQIPAQAGTSMVPPAGFRRSHPSVPPGTWSDDGSQALCLLASLLYRDGLDLADLGARFVNWMACGYMAVDGVVFDIGIQTSKSLLAVASGGDAAQSGGTHERSNGNGSLMRVAPLVAWHRGSDQELVELADRQGWPTHRHPRSRVCCSLYCLWLRRLDQANAWESSVGTLRELYVGRPEMQRELAIVLHHRLKLGTGYVVDSLLGARELLARHQDYASVVRAAVRLGDDSDTTAAIAGAAAGWREGVQGIPAEWLAALRERETVEELLAQL